jgi:hypothetical protein
MCVTPLCAAVRNLIAMQGPLSELFDQQQLVYDVSGAGNNWAHGHHGYGPQYRQPLSDQLRRAAEDADSLQVNAGGEKRWEGGRGGRSMAGEVAYGEEGPGGRGE